MPSTQNNVIARAPSPIIRASYSLAVRVKLSRPLQTRGVENRTWLMVCTVGPDADTLVQPQMQPAGARAHVNRADGDASGRGDLRSNACAYC